MEEGYSTIVDAILFLAMVSACALILSAAISSNERQRAAADASTRGLASSALSAMETAKVDYFEYRILGDRADRVAELCGIDPKAKLYRDTTNAVLGRGSRHKTVMEIASEDVACQFVLRNGDRTLKLNPLTGEYDKRAVELVDGFVRGRLDGRYSYCFTLRWTPFADVPLEGSISCGKPQPSGASSASAYITMPYRTEVTRDRIQAAVEPDLSDIENSTRAYKEGGDEAAFKSEIRASLARCLNNASGLMVDEAWNDTIGRKVPADDVHNPLAMLGSFSDNDSSPAGNDVLLNQSLDVKGTIRSLIVAKSADSLDLLADKIAQGISSGSMDEAGERDLILTWLQSRYGPSRARATLSVWVSA